MVDFLGGLRIRGRALEQQGYLFPNAGLGQLIILLLIVLPRGPIDRHLPSQSGGSFIIPQASIRFGPTAQDHTRHLNVAARINTCNVRDLTSLHFKLESQAPVKRREGIRCGA